MSLVILIVMLVAIIILWVVGYNSLIKYKNWIDESWSQIDVQLKRRHDLIPNLLESVKGYMEHERETLELVIKARNSINTSESREETIEQNDILSSGLKNIFALSESYPDLKANQHFLNLQEEVANTENKIAYARHLYNTTVVSYNTKIETIPLNLVAGIHHFTKKSVLEAKPEERENVKISF